MPSELPLLVQDAQLQGEPVGDACGFTTASAEPAAGAGSKVTLLGRTPNSTSFSPASAHPTSRSARYRAALVSQASGQVSVSQVWVRHVSVSFGQPGISQPGIGQLWVARYQSAKHRSALGFRVDASGFSTGQGMLSQPVLVYDSRWLPSNRCGACVFAVRGFWGLDSTWRLLLEP